MNFSRKASRLPLLILLAMPLFRACEAEAAPLRRLGLMIGANDGGRERVRLQYAGDDARTFARSMEELGGLDSEDLILLQDLDVAGLSQALDHLAERVREAKLQHRRVEAIIFYSGHADEQGLLLRGKRFSFPQFRAKVDGIPADVRIAVVDACASGNLTKLKGGRAFPAFLSDESNRATGYAFLTSSSADEAAQESDRIRASYFSHYLNTGLRGAADASQDGRVTLHEAYQYAYNETLARTENTAGGPQHASYDMRISGSGDVVMTELSRARSTLGLPDTAKGRFFIRDAEDRLLAEVNKTPGRPLSLALEPGAYKIRWHQEGGIQERSVVLKEGFASMLEAGSESGWTPVSRESTVARGSTPGEGWPHAGSGRQSQHRLFHNRSSGDFSGTQVTLLYNRADGLFDGHQLAAGMNRVGSDLRGIQASLGINAVRGTVHGGQVAWLFNWAGQDVRGLQISSGMNYAKTMTEGFQGTGFINMLEGDGRGAQGSGGVNLVEGSLTGIQIGMFGNLTGGDLVGAAFAVVGNLTRGDVRGSQVSGGFNIAVGAVEGYQVGFLNIAGSYREGAPIGVLNFVGDGTWRGDAWVDETGFTHMGLVSGSRHMHTRLALGSKALSDRELGAVTVETAGHFPLQPAFLELGLMASIIGGEAAEEVDFLQRLRLTAGVEMGRYFSLAAGVSWAVDITPENRRPHTDDNWLQRTSFAGRLHQWPGAHISLRAGVY